MKHVANVIDEPIKLNSSSGCLKYPEGLILESIVFYAVDNKEPFGALREKSYGVLPLAISDTKGDIFGEKLIGKIDSSGHFLFEYISEEVEGKTLYVNYQYLFEVEDR